MSPLPTVIKEPSTSLLPAYSSPSPRPSPPFLGRETLCQKRAKDVRVPSTGARGDDLFENHRMENSGNRTQ